MQYKTVKMCHCSVKKELCVLRVNNMGTESPAHKKVQILNTFSTGSDLNKVQMQQGFLV